MTNDTSLPTVVEIFDELTGLAGGMAAMLLPITLLAPGALAIVALLVIPVAILGVAALLVAALVGGPILLVRVVLRQLKSRPTLPQAVPA